MVRRFRLNRPRDEGRLQYTIRDWHMREIKRRGDVACTRPQTTIMFDPSERMWLLYASWHEAELPAGSGVYALRDSAPLNIYQSPSPPPTAPS